MIFGVTILVFFIMALSPIDQAYSVLGENATEAQAEQYREEHGLNDPILVQYGNFIVGLVQGDLGTYGANNASVADRIGEALPVTLQLTFFGLIIGVVIAVILGVISALYRDRWPDQIIRVFSIACIATPSFWLAVLMILLFSSMLHVLPASGPLPSLTADPGGWLARMAMPAIALGVPVAGQLTRVIRTSMVEELDKDYVRTALGAGIPKRVVVARNVLRNALITPVTVLGLRRRGHRGHLQPPGHGHGHPLRHPVQLHDARAGRRAVRGHHLHHHQHHRGYALYPDRSANQDGVATWSNFEETSLIRWKPIPARCISAGGRP